MDLFALHNHDVTVRWASDCPACPVEDTAPEALNLRIQGLTEAMDQLILINLLGGI